MQADKPEQRELHEKLAQYEKLEKSWAVEKQAYQKSMRLLEDELKKQKTINAKLMNKKNLHKRTCSDEQMFIFNQTNISSYYNHPVLVNKGPSHNWATKANLKSHLDGVRALCWLD